MRRRSGVLLLLCVGCLSCTGNGTPAGNVPTAERIRADALAAAKQANKAVLLIFTTQGDRWCGLLDDYHADPDVSRVLAKHFVLAQIDVYESPGGEHMYFEHAPRNIPSFVMLDGNGMHLADSGEGDQNVGFPNNPEQVDQYLAALKLACPHLSEEEQAILRGKLEAMRTTVSSDRPEER